MLLFFSSLPGEAEWEGTIAPPTPVTSGPPRPGDVPSRSLLHPRGRLSLAQPVQVTLPAGGGQDPGVQRPQQGHDVLLVFRDSVAVDGPGPEGHEKGRQPREQGPWPRGNSEVLGRNRKEAQRFGRLTLDRRSVISTNVENQHLGIYKYKSSTICAIFCDTL